MTKQIFDPTKTNDSTGGMFLMGQTKTGKLKDEMAKIAFGNLELRYAMAEAMLKVCKEYLVFRDGSELELD